MYRRINEITALEGNEKAQYLTFEPLKRFDRIVHGFSTKLGGCGEGMEGLNLGFGRGDSDATVLKNWALLGEAAGFDAARISFPNQLHTTCLRIAGKNTESHGSTPDTSAPIDGQITDTPGTVLISYGADCAPIYLIDEEHHAIGLCHSGWKGTLNAIAKCTAELMAKTYGTDPEALTALIGPSISKENYEVGYDVAGPFIEKYDIKVTQDSEIVSAGKREGKYQLDLWAANRAVLLDAGVLPENIYICGFCTYKEEDITWSHRRTGTARGAMAGFLAIRE
ncbi:MAG: peptidoglycan editing factor PgeF [Lachnospiraceae bacterium]|nr:peptidoglycan editing factor PgeF [Lachnospiraceae bacterium]